jgi:pilus assembly protein CpaB
MGRRTLLLLASILAAAAGTALIWIYVQHADARALAGWGRTVTVLRATATIDAGADPATVLAASESVAVPVRLVVARPVTSGVQLVGRVANVPILPGQFLQENQFDPAASTSGVAKGKSAVSITVADPNRVAGLLHPNLTVDVYYVDTGSDTTHRTGGSVRLLLQGVRVLGVGNTTAVRNARGLPAQIGTQTGVSATDVLLEVDPLDAKKVIMAATSGTVWFTVPGQGVQLPRTDGITSAELPVGRG